MKTATMETKLLQLLNSQLIVAFVNLILHKIKLL